MKKRALRLVLLGIGPLLGATACQHVNALAYFRTDAGGSSAPPCVAEVPGDEGTYRQTILRTDLCPSGRDVYYSLKGATKPDGASRHFSTETFFVAGAWIRFLADVGSDGRSGGEISMVRWNDEPDSVGQGLRWLPLSVSGAGEWWSTLPYEEGRAEGAHAECGRPPLSAVASYITGYAYRDVLRGWIKDCRGAPDCVNDPSRPFEDVDVLVYMQEFGDLECYYYGRWKDPATGRTEGLGLVKFELHKSDGTLQVDDFRYLVDCQTPVGCHRCP